MSIRLRRLHRKVWRDDSQTLLFSIDIWNQLYSLCRFYSSWPQTWESSSWWLFQSKNCRLWLCWVSARPKWRWSARWLSRFFKLHGSRNPPSTGLQWAICWYFCRWSHSFYHDLKKKAFWKLFTNRLKLQETRDRPLSLLEDSGWVRIRRGYLLGRIQGFVCENDVSQPKNETLSRRDPMPSFHAGWVPITWTSFLAIFKEEQINRSLQKQPEKMSKIVELWGFLFDDLLRSSSLPVYRGMTLIWILRLRCQWLKFSNFLSLQKFMNLIQS